MATIIRSPYPDVEIPDDPAHPVRPTRRQLPAATGPPSSTARPGVSSTYVMLEGRRPPLAAGLAARGFGKRRRVVGIYMPNCPSTRSHSTATAAGGLCTTANPLYTRRRSWQPAARLGGAMLLTIPPSSTARCEAAAAAGVEEVVVLGEAEGATPFESCSATRRRARARDRPRRGPRRAAVLERHHRTAEGRDADAPQPGREPLPVQPTAATRPRGPLIGFLPFFHIYGQTVVHERLPARRADDRDDAPLRPRPVPAADRGARITRAYVVPPIALALAKHPPSTSTTSRRCA